MDQVTEENKATGYSSMLPVIQAILRHWTFETTPKIGQGSGREHGSSHLFPISLLLLFSC